MRFMFVANVTDEDALKAFTEELDVRDQETGRGYFHLAGTATKGINAAWTPWYGRHLVP